jgi:Putative Flp pilus-assembly TadE/G-like
MLNSAGLNRPRGDDGQLTLLIIGFVAIAAVLVIVGVDASKVFLARRALSSAADAAAVAASQAVDKNAIYAGIGGGCGGLLPLDPEEAAQRAVLAVDDQAAGLRGTFAALDEPQTVVAADTVDVHLSGRVAVPFGHILALLVPGHDDGTVRIDATSHAQSPLTVPGGC